MIFRLVFDGSGDELDFIAVHPHLVEYYISENDGRKFAKCCDVDKVITDRLDNLLCTVVNIQEIANLYGLCYEFDTDCLDQDTLNHLHEYWANSHERIFNIDVMRNHTDMGIRQEWSKVHDLFPDEIREVTLSQVFKVMGYLETYEKLNMDIHFLESSFQKIIFDAVLPDDIYYLKIDNPFGNDILSNDICNLRLSYFVKGRTLYDKFINFDMTLEHDDENNHLTQSTRLELNLLQPQTIALSKEYVEWCNKHNRTPTGDFVNLGNLVDLYDNLTEYRHVIYRNLKKGNTCTLQI